MHLLAPPSVEDLPIGIAEFREFLNVDSNDTDDDAERTAKLLAAIGSVESRVGPLSVRTVTETAYPVGGWLTLSVGPLLSITTITRLGRYAGDPPTPSNGPLEVEIDRAALMVRLPGRLGGDTWEHEVQYLAGRDTVPAELTEAVLLVAEQLWQSQRGPADLEEHAGGGPSTPRGFAWPNRAKQLAEPHLLPTVIA